MMIELSKDEIKILLDTIRSTESNSFLKECMSDEYIKHMNELKERLKEYKNLDDNEIKRGISNILSEDEEEKELMWFTIGATGETLPTRERCNKYRDVYEEVRESREELKNKIEKAEGMESSNYIPLSDVGDDSKSDQ